MTMTTFEDFRDVLSAAAGTTCRSHRSDLAATIARIAAHPRIFSTSHLDSEWPGLVTELTDQGTDLQIDSSPQATRDQPCGLTTARGAIAESGSVVLQENSLESRSVSLMTERLIVLCPLDQLLPSLDDAANLLRDIASRGNSYATLVSGPSRTADIERQLTIGVQGPGELHVVFVED
jgi:L-lactate dehydrogenase complex protein LldG